MNDLTAKKLYLLGVVLLVPRLSQQIPAALFIGRPSREFQMLREIKAIINRKPDVNTNILIGLYWDAPYRQIIEAAFNAVGNPIENNFFDSEEAIAAHFSDLIKSFLNHDKERST